MAVAEKRVRRRTAKLAAAKTALPLLLCAFLLASCGKAGAANSADFDTSVKPVQNHGAKSFDVLEYGARGDLVRGKFCGVLDAQDFLRAAFAGKGFKQTLGSKRYKTFSRNLFSAFPKGAQPCFPICFYNIEYLSESFGGKAATLSALLIVPYSQGQGGSFPLVEINHATLFGKDTGPTTTDSNYSECLYAWYLATCGVAVLLPDYAGFGANGDFHPYIQKDSLGMCCRAALAAAVQFFEESGSFYKNKLAFDGRAGVAGYSEGGYATLACLCELAEKPVAGLQIELVLPMAAPADISGAMFETFRSDGKYPHPFYLPYVLLGWREMNRELLAEERVFSAAALEKVVPAFEENCDQATLEKTISDVLEGESAYTLLSEEAQGWIFRPDSSADGKAFFKLLQHNDLLDVPIPANAAVKIIASPADDSVPFKNSERLFERLSAKAADVELVALPKATHDKAFVDAWGCAYKLIVEALCGN